MRPVGFLNDGQGQRLLALVPVAQLPARAQRQAVEPTAEEYAALAQLLAEPAGCLELPIPVNPIRAARLAAAITQADLARVLGISQPMLCRQEQAFRRVRPASVARALAAIRRITENRGRPVIDLEAVLAGYGDRLAVSAAHKPRDPVERRLLQKAGDPVVARDTEGRIRTGGRRPTPPRRRGR